MKVQEILKEFIPCEVCGNRDINNFYLHVFVHQGSQPYVKCCECEEEFYSKRAEEIITRVKKERQDRKYKINPRTFAFRKENVEFYPGLSYVKNIKI